MTQQQEPAGVKADDVITEIEQQVGQALGQAMGQIAKLTVALRDTQKQVVFLREQLAARDDNTMVPS